MLLLFAEFLHDGMQIKRPHEYNISAKPNAFGSTGKNLAVLYSVMYRIMQAVLKGWVRRTRACRDC